MQSAHVVLIAITDTHRLAVLHESEVEIIASTILTNTSGRATALMSCMYIVPTYPSGATAGPHKAPTIIPSIIETMM
jgi:hypothetical protein